MARKSRHEGNRKDERRGKKNIYMKTFIRRICTMCFLEYFTVALFIMLMLFPVVVAAAESDEDLAKKALNPVAAMISLPLQFNQDYGIDMTDDAKRAWVAADATRTWPESDATRILFNIQPVIPFSLNQEWNIITRTIIPFIYAESPIPGDGHDSGLGDISQSIFLSPKGTIGGWIIGFGPNLLYPTASEDTLGSEKWGAGPTAVLLRQDSGFTYGLLTNHIWSFAGDDERADVSATFLQPFVSYTTKTYTTFGVNTESTYDWKNSEWTVPINVTLTQMLKAWGQPLSLQLGYCLYVDAPDNGPDWGLRFTLTFLFPKK